MRQSIPTLTSQCLPSAPTKAIDLTKHLMRRGFWLRKTTMRQAKKENKTQRHSQVQESLITVTCSRPMPTKMTVLINNLLLPQAIMVVLKCREMACAKTTQWSTSLVLWPPTRVKLLLLLLADSRLDTITTLLWFTMKVREEPSIQELIHHLKRLWWSGMPMTMA